MLNVNDAVRQKVRERMAELGLTQAELARRITEKRREQGKDVEVTRHAVNRAISEGGELPPIWVDMLDELQLTADVKPKAPERES